MTDDPRWPKTPGIAKAVKMIYDTSTKLRRNEAAAFLTVHGYQTATGTLAKLACLGGGPPFEVYVRYPMYDPADLLAWARSRISRRARVPQNEGELRNGYRLGWYWLRLNRGDPVTGRREARTWICVEWRGAGAFSTLGVQWCDVEGLGDETAYATLGPYLGTAPPA